MTKTGTTETQRFAFSFVDAEGVRVRLEAEIKEGRFSISGSRGSSSGQVSGSIKPATNAQRAVVDTWERWHLNDMTAGTPEQEKALKDARAAGELGTYEKAVAYLRSVGLYEVAHPTKKGKRYTYGSAWLKRKLPATLAADLRTLEAVIKREDYERARTLNEAKPDSEGTAKTWEDVEDPKVEALARFLEMTAGEALEDVAQEAGDCVYAAAGEEFLVCTDDEADEEAKRSLENYVDECVLHEIPESYRRYFDTEKFVDEALSSDGRGHTLGRYDGEENEIEVGGVTYYIYKQ